MNNPFTLRPRLRAAARLTAIWPVLLLSGCSMMFPPTVRPKTSGALPRIDGVVDAEWANVKPLRVKARPNTPAARPVQAEVSSIRTDDRIAFLIRWEDTTPSESYLGQSAEKDGGTAAGEADDQLAVMFRAPGTTIHSCMLSGRPYENDVWAWKAARTNPSGFAEDKRIRIEVAEKSAAAAETPGEPKEYVARHGKIAAISWPADAGTALVVQTPKLLDAPADEPAFKIQAPTGSQADVEARARWSDGIWTLEIARQLDTGHQDDQPLVIGETQKFALAIFDRTEGPAHANTRYLKLKLK